MSHALDDLKAKAQRFIRVRFRLEAEGLSIASAPAGSGGEPKETNRIETDPPEVDAGDTDIRVTERQQRDRFVLKVAVHGDTVRYDAATDTWHLASTEPYRRYSVSDVTRLARALAAGEGTDALLRLGIALEDSGLPVQDLMAKSFDARFSTGMSSGDTTRADATPSTDVQT